MNFKEIEFGKADALDEGVELPNLLIEGYLDPQNMVRSALETSSFLFLGNKGSGKSALSQHLQLTKSSYHLFVKNILLEDFPYKSFNKIISGNADSEVKFPIAWDWLLLIYAIQSLSDDHKAVTILQNEFSQTLDSLRKIGILPAENIRDIVSKSAKNSFKINLLQMFEFAFEGSNEHNSSELQFLHLIDFLKKVVKEFESECQHLLIIDGLDEILSTREIQYQSLAALISEVKKLNVFFRQNDVPLKILLLCRTDLFERLPHPNKNKIRQDGAILINWFEDTSDSKNSNIIKLANLRGRLKYPELQSVFEEFFPNNLEGKEIHKFLLDHTRHTPRDFLQLLKHIQKITTAHKISIDRVLKGINSYSINYFLPEIKDELVGYIDFKLVDDLFRIISSLGKRDFYLREIQELVDKKSSTINAEDVFNTLFECSAIGHIYRNDGDKNYFVFKFRNPNSSFNPSDRIILHRGIWKSLNLIR